MRVLAAQCGRSNPTLGTGTRPAATRSVNQHKFVADDGSPGAGTDTTDAWVLTTPMHGIKFQVAPRHTVVLSRPKHPPTMSRIFLLLVTMTRSPNPNDNQGVFSKPQPRRTSPTPASILIRCCLKLPNRPKPPKWLCCTPYLMWTSMR